MSKVIIMEGPDNCGKSTQIKMLLKYLTDAPTHIIHYSNISGISSNESMKYSKILYDDMFKLITESFLNSRNLILDRAHLGEYVYSPIYRDYKGDYVFELEKKWMENLHRKNDIYLFLFIDEPENLVSREDGLSFTTEINKKKQEIEMFKEAFNKSSIINKFPININGVKAEQVHEFVKDVVTYP